MKKRFTILATAALVVAAVSMPATASAGTVAVKGDTQVQMHGFLGYRAGWADHMDGTPIKTNVPFESSTYNAKNKTRFASTLRKTRLGFAFKNEDANLTGKVEGDFDGSDEDAFRLRRAFIEHHFDNFYLLVGQEWGVEEVHTFSVNWKKTAGFGKNKHNRMPQVQIGTNLNFNGAELKLALAFEDRDWVGNKGNVVARKTMPAIAAKAKLKFNTGIGNPARIYAFATAMPVEIKDTDNNGNVIGDQSEIPYIFGVGFKLPVSLVTLQSEYIYAKGANQFAALAPDSYTPASYYRDATGFYTNKFYAYNIETKVKAMSNLSIACGYDDLNFEDDTSFLHPIDGGYDQGFNKPEYKTYFGNVVYKTTKYTTLALEWDHVKHSADNYDSQIGNHYFLSYTYNF